MDQLGPTAVGPANERTKAPRGQKGNDMDRLSNAGYHHCPCRDCFEIAIGCDDDDTPHLCASCETAGCDADGDSECDAPHAYCSGDERSGNPDVMIDGIAYCPVCGLEF